MLWNSNKTTMMLATVKIQTERGERVLFTLCQRCLTKQQTHHLYQFGQMHKIVKRLKRNWRAQISAINETGLFGFGWLYRGNSRVRGSKRKEWVEKCLGFAKLWWDVWVCGLGFSEEREDTSWTWLNLYPVLSLLMFFLHSISFIFIIKSYQ